MRDPLDILGIAGALYQVLRPIIAKLKRFAGRKKVKNQLASGLNPALMKMETSIGAMSETGEILIEMVSRLSVPPKRQDAMDLYSLIADQIENTATLLEGLRELSREAKSIVRNEGFMADLLENYKTGYDLLRLLARNSRDGMMYFEDFPGFLRVHATPRMRKEMKRFEEATVEGVREAAPLLDKVKALRRNLPKPYNRQLVLKLSRALGRLLKEAAKFGAMDRESASQMAEMSPDWMKPILALAKDFAPTTKVKGGRTR